MNRDASLARHTNRESLRADLSCRSWKPQSLPPYLRLESGTPCDLGCRHCFQTRESRPASAGFSKDLLDYVARELFPTAEILELGAENEPLRDPLLGQVLDRLEVQDGPRIDLITSGHGLPAWLPRLFPHLRRLVVSIEAIDPSLAKLARPYVSLPDLLRMLEGFASQAPKSVQLWFRVATFNGNYERLPELIARLQSFPTTGIEVVPGIAPSNPDPGLEGISDAARLGAFFARAEQVASPYKTRISLPGRGLPWPVQAQDSDGTFPTWGVLPWSAPWTRATISMDGMVSLCCRSLRMPLAPAVLIDRARPFVATWHAVPFQVARRSPHAVPACAHCVDGMEPVYG